MFAEGQKLHKVSFRARRARSGYTRILIHHMLIEVEMESHEQGHGSGVHRSVGAVHGRSAVG
jgi:hypothetical protein